MKYFDIITDRNHDRSAGFGLSIYFHRHMVSLPIHFHICFTFVLWFIEIHIGREYDGDDE